MENLLTLFSNNILPIFVTAGAGFILSKRLALDPRSISRVIFYLFSPFLVFKLLTENELENKAIAQMIGITVSATLVIGLIAYLTAKVFKFNRKLTIVLLLTTMFTNAGNYGLSLNEFAFGADALAYASIYFVCSSATIYTIGVIVASMGKTSLKKAFLGLFRLPTMYALIIAIIFNYSNFSISPPFQRSIDLLAQATIPCMLVLLGLQLGQATRTTQWTALGSAAVIRLVVSPLVAYGLSIPLGLQGPALQAGVTEASMPTAVMVTVLATEYEIEPALVTTIVTTTTLLSPLTLTPLLAFLGG